MVAGAVGILQYSQSWHSQAAEELVATTVGDMLAAMVADTRDPVELEPAATCARLARHPAVLGASIHNAAGIVEGSSWRFPEVEQLALTTPVDSRQSVAVEVPAGPDHPACVAHLVTVPLHGRGNVGGRLRLALLFEQPVAPWYHRVWLWSIPILVLGAISSALAVRRLRREFVSTLSRLEHMIRVEGSEEALTQLSQDAELAELAGALVALQRERNEWRARAEQTARTVDAHVAQRTQAIHSELKKAQREVWIDPLTGLNNRRVLQDRFGAIFDAQREARQDLSVVMLDIDHFKQLNDSLGHVCGDQLLKFAADLLRGALRANDIAVRYGGDEFVLILPSVNSRDAASIARRLVSLFGQRTRLLPHLERHPSLSAGVASLWEHKPASADDLLEIADKALYDAKRRGKNEVCVFPADSADEAPASCR